MRISNKLILYVIIIVATTARFYDFFNIPLSHDELSALLRTRFDNFSDLINFGVIADTHPAGVQVFMYYWIQIFGTAEWVIKLPFLLMGITAIVYFYKLGKLWYNESVGLFGAAFMASTQYMIMYGQMARPYVSGLLLTLLMVYFWSKMIKESNIKFSKNLTLFILFGSLSTYNHHFSLFFTGLVCLVGLFYIPKHRMKAYLIALLAVGLLYLPHISIFFLQLEKGGVGEWLKAPSNDWLIEFIYYAFNFSSVVICVLISIILLGTRHRAPINKKQFLLFFTLFFTPFLVGFLYSKYVNPVIQFSVLIFSFPYFYFLIFGHLKNLKSNWNAIIVGVILITSLTTTIYHRNHYQLFYQDPIKSVVLDYQFASQEIKKENLAVIMLNDCHKAQYYFDKYNIDTTFNCLDNSYNNKKLVTLVRNYSANHDFLFLGSIVNNKSELIPIIQNYFPKIEWERNYAGATTILFSKTGKTNNTLISNQNFEQKNKPNWQEIPTSHVIDSVCFSKSHSFYFDSLMEWSPNFEKELSSIINHQNNFIDISVKVKKSSNIGDAMLVASIDFDDKNLYWAGSSFKDFKSNQIKNSEWINVHLALKLSDMTFNSEAKLTVYIWNKSKSNFIVDDLKIELRNGNPYIYGLVEQF